MIYPVGRAGGFLVGLKEFACLSAKTILAPVIIPFIRAAAIRLAHYGCVHTDHKSGSNASRSDTGPADRVTRRTHYQGVPGCYEKRPEVAVGVFRVAHATILSR